jgi:hypothetical protein
LLVVEVELPDFARWRNHQISHVWQIRHDQVIVEYSQHYPATQRIASQYVVLSPGPIQLCPEVLRYVSSAELDLMAELSGLTPLYRWSDWSRRPVTDDSRWLVAVYRQSALPNPTAATTSTTSSACG